jgi:integrase
VWLYEPVRNLLSDVLAVAASTSTMQSYMRDLCAQLKIGEKVTPHDLRRTFCSKVTALGFGRDAMNRLSNHREGGIADVYDRHAYESENKRIMTAVAQHILDVAEGRSNVVELRINIS